MKRTLFKRWVSAFLCFCTVLTMLSFCSIVVHGASGDLIAYVADENTNVYAERYSEYLSQSGNKSAQWSGFAWRGDETLSRIDILTRSTAYPDAVLSAGNLVSDTGAVIDKKNIDFTYLDAVMVEEKKLSLFDIITPHTTHDLEANRMYSAWVSIHVPEDAAAGVYTTTLSIVSAGKSVASFTYTLTVYDLVQPALDSIVDLWMWPYNSIRYYSGQTTDDYWDCNATDDVAWQKLFDTRLDGKYLPALESELALYAKAGGDTVFAQVNEYNRTNGDPYPSLIKWYREADGSMTYDYSDFDLWVELNMKYGIDKQIKCYAMGNFINTLAFYDKARKTTAARSCSTGDPIWQSMWGAFLDDFITHLEQKGWFDITYMALDEKDHTITKAVIDEVKKHKNKKGQTLKIATAVATFDCEDLFDDIADLSLAYGLSGGHLVSVVEDRNAKGLITTIYTCGPQGSSMLNDAGQSAESIHVTYKEGTTGFLRWALQKYNADPFKTSKNYNEELCAGDCYLIYPSSNDSMIAQSTPRYEKLCEGLRDIEKMRLLESELAWMKNEVHDAMLETCKQPDFRAVIDTYSAIAQEKQSPRFTFDAPAVEVQIGEKTTLALGEDAQYLRAQMAEKTYIDDAALKYSDGWTNEGQYFWLFLYSTNHYIFNNSASTSYEFDFYGDSFVIKGSKGGDYGIAKVYIDGDDAGEMDLYTSGGTAFYSDQYVSGILKQGNHHVKVVGTGRKNSKSSGSRMQVDYVATSVSAPIQWHSDDESVATVAADGTITGVRTGKTVITAQCGRYVASAVVTVKADKTALQAKIDECAKLDLSGYSEQIRTDYAAAIDAARAVCGDASATAEQIAAAYDSLERAGDALIDSIEFAARPTKTAFTVGQRFECNNNQLTVKYKDGSSAVTEMRTDMVSGYDAAFAGIQMLTVTYGGKQLRYAVAVIEDIDLSAMFTDVADDWYYQAVQYAVSNQLFNGVSLTTFEPGSPMNRAMLVTVLYRMEGKPSTEGLKNKFTDVKPGDWFYDAVLWANATEIVNGMDKDKYAPTLSISREQIATILYRHAQANGYSVSERADLSAYKDGGTVSDWAENALSWANAVGLIGGMSSTELAPRAGATRAQVATILMRYSIIFAQE